MVIYPYCKTDRKDARAIAGRKSVLPHLVDDEEEGTGYVIMPEAAVVIDIGPDATRIGVSGSGTCTYGPALGNPLGDSSIEATCSALHELALSAGIAKLAGRHILVTENIDQRNGSAAARERWVTLLFEDLGAASVYVAERSCLSLYTMGMTSGIVVDVSNAVVIYEGYSLPHAVKRLDGAGASSIARAAYDAAASCDADLKKPLLDSVVLCGRAGFDDSEMAQVQRELAALTAGWNVSFPGRSAVPVVVRTAEHGPASAWFGGELLAGLDPGAQMWIRRNEYDEQGASIVHRKCC